MMIRLAMMILIALTGPAKAEASDRAQALIDVADFLTKSGWECNEAIAFLPVRTDSNGAVARVICEVNADGRRRLTDYRVTLPFDPLDPVHVTPWK